METVLEPHLDWRDIILGSSIYGEKINDAYSRRFKLDKHSSVADVEGICGREVVEGYYLFALVRHPVDRICSLYNFISLIVLGWAKRQKVDPCDLRTHITAKTMEEFPALKWPASRAFVASTDFSEFIRNPVLMDDKAFHSQVSRLTRKGGSDIAGDAFRLEDRAQWLALLHRRLGFEFQLPHANKSTPIMTRSGLSSIDQAFIEEEFQEDMARFGY